MRYRILILAGMLSFVELASAQPDIALLPVTLSIKTDMISFKGQRTQMDYRSQLQLGEINQLVIKTQPVIFTGQRNRNINKR
ncbi:MAG: hypothetical protein P8Y20_08420 [Gammaproteobacteria bacterium]